MERDEKKRKEWIERGRWKGGKVMKLEVLNEKK